MAPMDVDFSDSMEVVPPRVFSERDSLRLDTTNTLVARNSSITSNASLFQPVDPRDARTIMLLGRWSSDAFLRYIRKQVEQFSAEVSKRMIQKPLYHHVPDLSLDDPRTHNPLSATANCGMGSSRTISRTVFSVWA